MEHISFIFLAVGLLFDLMSFFYGLASLLSKRYMSGFLFVALPFYAVSVFLLPEALVLFYFQHPALLAKIAAFLGLCVLHFICQSPGKIARLRYVLP